jgi:hypothetical protein
MYEALSSIPSTVGENVQQPTLQEDLHPCHFILLFLGVKTTMATNPMPLGKSLGFGMGREERIHHEQNWWTQVLREYIRWK